MLGERWIPESCKKYGIDPKKKIDSFYEVTYLKEKVYENKTKKRPFYFQKPSHFVATTENSDGERTQVKFFWFVGLKFWKKKTIENMICFFVVVLTV